MRFVVFGLVLSAAVACGGAPPRTPEPARPEATGGEAELGFAADDRRSRELPDVRHELPWWYRHDGHSERYRLWCATWRTLR